MNKFFMILILIVVFASHVFAAVKYPSVKLDIQLKTKNFKSTKLKMIVPFGESGSISHGNTKIGNQKVTITPSRDQGLENGPIKLNIEISENGQTLATPQMVVNNNSAATVKSSDSDGTQLYKLRIVPTQL